MNREKHYARQSSKVCPRCKHEYRGDDKYCGNCGVTVTGSGDNNETVGTPDAHKIGGILPVSSPRSAYGIKHRNLRRALFFLVLFLIIGATFMLGIDVGKTAVVIPPTPQVALPTPYIYTVSVDAAKGFPGTNTLINLAAGDQLIIKASGTASNCAVCPLMKPDGMGNGKTSDSVYPQAFIGTLLGSIGQVGTQASTAWFVVGNSYSSTVSVSGPLYLICNDSAYSDNSGSYQVIIVVEKGRRTPHASSA